VIEKALLTVAVITEEGTVVILLMQCTRSMESPKAGGNPVSPRPLVKWKVLDTDCNNYENYHMWCDAL
jgi:hypothetical protein